LNNAFLAGCFIIEKAPYQPNTTEVCH